MCIWTGFLDNQIAWLPVHKDYKNIILCVCVFTAAMFDGSNNETVLHERLYFPGERKCIVFALQ